MFGVGNLPLSQATAKPGGGGFPSFGAPATVGGGSSSSQGFGVQGGGGGMRQQQPAQRRHMEESQRHGPLADVAKRAEAMKSVKPLAPGTSIKECLAWLHVGSSLHCQKNFS